MLLSRTVHKLCIRHRMWLVVGQLGLQMICCPVGLVEPRLGFFLDRGTGMPRVPAQADEREGISQCFKAIWRLWTVILICPDNADMEEEHCHSQGRGGLLPTVLAEAALFNCLLSLTALHYHNEGATLRILPSFPKVNFHALNDSAVYVCAPSCAW